MAQGIRDFVAAYERAFPSEVVHVTDPVTTVLLSCCQLVAQPVASTEKGRPLDQRARPENCQPPTKPSTSLPPELRKR